MILGVGKASQKTRGSRDTRVMDQSDGDRSRPWWYRVPPIAVVLISYSAAGIVIYTWVSESGVAWAGGGLVVGLAAGVVHGAAQGIHDGLHR